MRGREGVADEDVAELGERLAKAGSFFSSPLWKRRFSSTAMSPSCRAATTVRRRLADAVGGEGDRLAQQLGQLVGHRLQAELGSGPPLGRPKCEMTMTLAPRLGKVLQAGHQPLQPRRVA